jgi:hypothetical protein
MIIKNISPKKIYLSWVGVCGKWILPDKELTLKDEFISDIRLKSLVERGFFSVVSYDSSIFSIVTQEELNSLGPSSSGEFLEINKDTDSSIIQSLPVNGSVVSVAVKIDTVFDGTKSFSVGTPADHDLFVGSSEIDITQEGVYYFNVLWTAEVATSVNLYATGTATQGSGFVYVIVL